MTQPTDSLCRHYNGSADCPPICLLLHGERYQAGDRHTHTAHVEPDATSREVAAVLRQQYLALREQGFTSRETCVLLGQLMAAGAVHNAITEKMNGDD